eukprot:7097435-Prymnesium_polylepis.1
MRPQLRSVVAPPPPPPLPTVVAHAPANMREAARRATNFSHAIGLAAAHLHGYHEQVAVRSVNSF